jgi:hypothetical protein
MKQTYDENILKLLYAQYSIISQCILPEKALRVRMRFVRPIYLFMYGLFNDADSCSHNIASKVRMIMNLK